MGSNSKLVLAANTQIVSETVEYTEGSTNTPYFILSAMGDDPKKPPVRTSR